MNFQLLDWINTSGSILEYEPDIGELMEAGYVAGFWAGSIDYPAYISYRITSKGEKALKDWNRWVG